MNSLAIAQQINTFAQNPATQSLIVGDENMITTLLNFLKDSNSDVATLQQSLEAFNALAKNPSFRPTINALPGFSPLLADLCDHSESVVGNLAQCTLDNLSGVNDKKEKVTLPTVTAVRAGAFGTRGYVYNTLIHVPQMSTEAQRNEIEAAVLKVSGIVSVNIDMQLRNINIYSSIKSEEFAPVVIKCIEDCGFTASHVGSKQDTKTSKPGYAQKPNCASGKEALVRYVDKNAKKKEETSSGWLGGISSYFW